MVFRGIHTKRLECGEYDEDRRPAVPKREWKMNEKLLKVIRWSVALLDDVVDVLTGVLSGATSRDAQLDRRHTVTAELTKSAMMNATYSSC
jgi:hypothetical protein